MMLLFRCADKSCAGNYSVKALFPIFHIPYSPGYLNKCSVCGQLGVSYPKFTGKKVEEPDDELMENVRRAGEELLKEKLMSMLGGKTENANIRVPMP